MIGGKRLFRVIVVCVLAVAAIVLTVFMLIQLKKNQIPDQVPAIKPGEDVVLGTSDETDEGTEIKYDDIQKSEGLKYELSNNGNGYIVTGIGTCMDRDIVIPEEYKGKPVIAIGDGAFAGVSIQTVTMSNCIKGIGAKVFEGCNNLEIFFYGTKTEWANITKADDWAAPGTYKVWPTEKEENNWGVPVG